jgi:probable phosphoglycerate mutase
VGQGAAGALRVVLVRHGEAACNLNGVVGGMLGCTGLTTRGVAQAEALRDRLARTGELFPTVALYSSTLPRAIETAEIVAPALTTDDGRRPLAVVRDPDLCELRPGEADGLTWEQFTERFTQPDWDRDPSDPIAPGGESWTGFVARAATALRTIAARAASDVSQQHDQSVQARRGGGEPVVVVVCHAGVIEASLLRLLPVDPAVPRLRLRTAHASLTEWRVESEDWLLERYNDDAHGRPEQRA